MPADNQDQLSIKESICRPPTFIEKHGNIVFGWATYFFAWLTVLLVLYIVCVIGIQAAPAIRDYGWGFITGTTWDANKHRYRGVTGNLGHVSSLLALVIGTVFGVAVAVFLSERFLSTFVFSVEKLFGVQFHPFWAKLPDQFDNVLKNLIELLAAIPSVVYGLWGNSSLYPDPVPVCDWLNTNLGWIPIFNTTLSGPGMLPAAIVLAIMILPTVSAISLNSLLAVPPKLREASYGLGATRWETILAILIPTASKGIFGSIILAFGHALGETMALAMLVGNANVISWSLFSRLTR